MDVKPKNVSSHLWQKFKALEKRTDEVTQKSRDRRIKQLQKQVIDTVTREFTPADKRLCEKYVKLPTSADSTDDVMKLPSSIDIANSVKTHRNKVSGSSKEVKEPTSGAITQLEDYFNINDHLQERDNSRPAPPTALEKRINEAIKKGDMDTAESLSDHMATREAGEKIVSAIEAKRFLEQKQVQEISTRAKRKRKLNWGFEPKHRWETKGNM